MTEPLVYIVDDDEDLRDAVLDTLEDAGLPAEGFSSASPALAKLNPEWPGIVVSDIRMPGMGGMEFLHAARDQFPEIPFVMITGHGDVQTATNAMKAGAFDFLEKPARPEYLVDVVRRALEMRRLQIENSNLKTLVADGGALKSRLIGRSKVMKALRKEILAVAPLKIDVLLLGETGTGKELTAQSIHDLSPHSDSPFETVNCGMLSDGNWQNSIEVKLTSTDGSTLFLDELEALPEPLQLRLLALIETRDSNGPRIIAALKSDPAQLIAEGRLRADLYYRINVAQIILPPLTERENDLFVLLEFFIRDAAARHQLKLPEITQDMLNPLRVHSWPGNVRELRNAAEKMVIGLPLALTPGTSEAKAPFGEGESYDDAMGRFEKALLRHALMQAGGRKGLAAESLGIPRKRLYLRLKTLGLD
ncbi:sigma-54-dependent Fis family transcriptional regulator [Sedimentitalea sp. CY04]|uniref:Sigma-54-dependent Fis family transcriptional regulator n=1 Tax=Parasedimentitalea denitrificans TaxID=2211118 RepID=A0ABX0WE53_9RHOB|nr:sigma-54-dependent Fis family transcriptional regulator [Sedimentitalea sp. CY04]